MGKRLNGWKVSEVVCIDITLTIVKIGRLVGIGNCSLAIINNNLKLYSSIWFSRSAGNNAKYYRVQVHVEYLFHADCICMFVFPM